MAYNSKESHQGSLQSAKSMNVQWIQRTQAHRNRTAKAWKFTWFEGGRFSRRHPDARVRIWHQQYACTSQTWLKLTVRAVAPGGVMAWGMLS